MRILAHLLLFKALYLAAVLGAAHGQPWAGPLALVPFVAIHLALTPGALRGRELAYLAGAGLAGTAMDSVLRVAGVTGYASIPAGWPTWLVPPWIISLWVAFATLPGLMRWLHGRPWLAAAFGAVSGPFSFWCGGRLGAALLPDVLVTSAVLAVQYALVLPLMVQLAPGREPSAQSSASAISPSMART